MPYWKEWSIMLNTDIITPPKVEPIDEFLADLDDSSGVSPTHRTARTVSSKAYKLGIVDGDNRRAMAQNQADILNRTVTTCDGVTDIRGLVLAYNAAKDMIAKQQGLIGACTTEEDSLRQHITDVENALVHMRDEAFACELEDDRTWG